MNARAVYRRRLKIRFSLRGLLLAVLLLGCGLGWLVSELRQAKQRRETVSKIRNVRGHATYDYQVHPEADWILPRLLRAWIGEGFLSRVEKVSIHNARDGDLESVRNLRSLNDLRLNSRYVTDAGLSCLGALESLERLDLWCSQVTDDGLRHIRGLRKLSVLDLYGTRITDAGLLDLQCMTNLRVLKVRDTQVTSAGVTRLRAALPNCDVVGHESIDPL
jgi:hypothetical protein